MVVDKMQQLGAEVVHAEIQKFPQTVIIYQNYCFPNPM